LSYTKTILCLAASGRPGGYCFAGKNIKTGEWIRPVSANQGEAISDQACTGSDGVRAKVLDVLEIPLLRATPRDHQTENHLIDPNGKWRITAEGNWRQVERALDDHNGPLWSNGSASWGYRNNRVPEPQVKAFDHSLVLIRPKALKISVAPKGGMYADAEKRLVKANFLHAGI
jgi:hypothetical protein